MTTFQQSFDEYIDNKTYNFLITTYSSEYKIKHIKVTYLPEAYAMVENFLKTFKNLSIGD